MASLVFFITGVSSGLGLEIALKVCEGGHLVVGTVRNRQRAAHAVEQIESHGGKVFELDVTHADACFEVVHKVEQVHGRIDVLVNNAGMAYAGALEDFTDDEVQAQFDVNVFGPYRLIRASLPGFRDRRQGTIVNISSVSGVDGGIASGLYAASKFAIEGLSEGLARELAEYNVNVIIPELGAFRTGFLGAFQVNSKAHLELYPTAKTTMKVFETFNGKQKGDPVKAAQRIVEVVTGQGLAGHLKGKVLRLPLGPDCISRYETKVKSMAEDLEKAREVGMGTNVIE